MALTLKKRLTVLMCSVIVFVTFYVLTLLMGTTDVIIEEQQSYNKADIQLQNYNNKAIDKKVEQKDIADRFGRRVKDIKRACERYKGIIDNSNLKVGRLLYLKENKILFCPIQKTASTFWQKILYAISHMDEINDSFEVNPMTAYSNRKFQKITKNDSLSDIVRDSVSFMFVRDPFTRLFSGWLDKFNNVNTAYWKFGKEIIKEERHNAHLKSLNCGHDVSFKEFVSFVSKRILSGRGMDGHFSPSVDHCNACELNFTYIGKYDTLEEDTKFIVNQFRDGTKIRIESNFKKRSVLDMIRDSTDFLYSQKEALKNCMSIQCGLFRVWMRLTSRGIISKTMPFPFPELEKADNVTKDEFIGALIEAHEKSNAIEIANNRREVLAEAYQSLGNETFNQMLLAFEMDFALFGYSTKPDFLQMSDHMSNKNYKAKKYYKYLKDCPY